MNKLFLLFGILIASNSFAQDSIFTFTKNQLLQVRKYSYDLSPTLLKQKKIKIARFDTIKTYTAEYQKRLEQEKKFLNDSIAAVEQHNFMVKEHKTLASISERLKSYNSANVKFKEKKHFLIEAQNLADSLGNPMILYSMISHRMIKPALKNVIYADNDINSKFKKDFKEINSNDDIFSEHINLIIKRIESYPEPKFVWERKYNNYNYISPDRKINKYDYKFIFKDSILIDGYEKDHELNYLTLSGTYKRIEKFYYTTKYEVILASNIKDVNIAENNIRLIKFPENNHYDNLLQNTETKQIISCNNSLLYEYERTKNDEDYKAFNERYIIWKSNYISLVKTGKKNIDNCNAILERNTFINAFGQSRWNADLISKKDKLEFNRNYDLLSDKIDAIRKLEHEKDGEFLNHFLDNPKDNEGVDAYLLSVFHMNVKKFFIK